VLAAVAAAWALSFVWGELSGTAIRPQPAAGAAAAVRAGLPAARLAAGLGQEQPGHRRLVAWFYLTYTEYDPLRMIFAVIFLIGGSLTCSPATMNTAGASASIRRRC
jgi:hypothetical protein